MKNIVPPMELPAHVQPVRFNANEEMKEAGIQDAIGIVHYPEEMTDPDNRYPGDIVAVEMMFEISKEELLTLMHEPFITITMLTDQLPPTQLSTSFPFDPRYKLMTEHTHRCPSCEAPWRCMNPLHKMPESRKMFCDGCWEANQNEIKDKLLEQDDEVDDEPEGEVES